MDTRGYILLVLCVYVVCSITSVARRGLPEGSIADSKMRSASTLHDFLLSVIPHASTRLVSLEELCNDLESFPMADVALDLPQDQQTVRDPPHDEVRSLVCVHRVRHSFTAGDHNSTAEWCIAW